MKAQTIMTIKEAKELVASIKEVLDRINDLETDLRTALKIINADIGMKNSILAQCDPGQPGLDDMRRSIQEGERLLTKHKGIIEQ